MAEKKISPKNPELKASASSDGKKVAERKTATKRLSKKVQRSVQRKQMHKHT